MFGTWPVGNNDEGGGGSKRKTVEQRERRGKAWWTLTCPGTAFLPSFLLHNLASTPSLMQQQMASCISTSNRMNLLTRHIISPKLHIFVHQRSSSSKASIRGPYSITQQNSKPHFLITNLTSLKRYSTRSFWTWWNGKRAAAFEPAKAEIKSKKRGGGRARIQWRNKLC